MSSLTTELESIIETHHIPLKRELPLIVALSDKARTIHGDAHPELIRLCEVIHTFVDEMNSHLHKEENILFPMMRKLDTIKQGGGGTPSFHCGSISNPIRQMEVEHRDFDKLLTEMRTLTSDFTPPEWACNTYRTLFEKLAWLEADTIAHATRENEALFPSAMEKEKTIQ